MIASVIHPAMENIHWLEILFTRGIIRHAPDALDPEQAGAAKEPPHQLYRVALGDLDAVGGDAAGTALCSGAVSLTS